MDWLIVEVVIGLSFLFFLLSIVSSAVNEGIAGVFKLRARMLEKGIVNLVTGKTHPPSADAELVDKLYAHSLINGYGQDGSKPSYMASRSFRNALLDITDLLESTGETSEDPLRAEEIRQQVQSTIDGIPHEHLRTTLNTIWRSVHHDANEFRAGVERWFDRGMERVSGWYKRRTQLMLFVLGLVIAVAVNASALGAADELWKNDGVRDGLVAQVENQVESPSGGEAMERLEDLGFPIGWEEENRPSGTGGWAAAILGWLMTAIAISFGAPFWFDVLGKVSNLRAAGRKPESVLPPAPAPAEVSTVRLTVDTQSEPPEPIRRAESLTDETKGAAEE